MAEESLPVFMDADTERVFNDCRAKMKVYVGRLDQKSDEIRQLDKWLQSSGFREIVEAAGMRWAPGPRSEWRLMYQGKVMIELPVLERMRAHSHLPTFIQALHSALSLVVR